MELVIFDCDGVLVDSEALALDVESAMLTAAGSSGGGEPPVPRWS